jgi:tRNA-2-methylthio-N6-dimethylallyladenosine synthase
VPDAVRHERLLRLQRTIDARQAAFNARCLGQIFEVLFERSGRYPGQLVGRSPYLQTVQVDTGEAPPLAIGDIARVTVTELSPNSLFGALAA